MAELGDSSYEIVRDAVFRAFNPPDGDAAEEAIVVDAIERAARFIEIVRPCTCQSPEHAPYNRCLVLGRVCDERRPR